VPDNNRELKSSFYAQAADIYHLMGQQDSAFAAYENALQWNERNIPALNNYAYFLALADTDLNKAERLSARCIQLEPDNPTYLDTYAWIFFKQRNYTLALFYIKSAIDNDSTHNAELIDHYGDILFFSGDKDEALIQWQKAQQLGKDTPILQRKIAEQSYFDDPNAR